MTDASPPIAETFSGGESSNGANAASTSSNTAPSTGLPTTIPAPPATIHTPAVTKGSSQQQQHPMPPINEQQQQQYIPATPVRSGAVGGGSIATQQTTATTFATQPPSFDHHDEDLSISHNSQNDESTEPVSVMTGSVGSTSADDDGTAATGEPTSFGRFIKNTKKRLNVPSLNNNNNNDDPDDINPAEDDDEQRQQQRRRHRRNGSKTKTLIDENIDGEGSITKAHRPMISGYLHKLGRNGKWQRRWFETDGEDLTYYKNEDRTKVLAKLDLCKVGAITVDGSDTSQCTFKIQVAGRPYSLRAESNEKCKYWVITLNRIKEAKMHIGGLGLIHQKPPDLLDSKIRTASEDYTERIVLTAQRQRAHAVMVDDEIKNNWEQVLLEKDPNLPPDFLTNSPRIATKSEAEGVETQMTVSHADHNQLLRITDTALPEDVSLAKWKKSRAILYRMSNRIVRWYRRVKTLRCKADEHDIIQTRFDATPSTSTDHENFDIPSTIRTTTGGGKAKTKGVAATTSGGSVTDGKTTDGPVSFRGVEGESLSEWITREKDRETSGNSKKASDATSCSVSAGKGAGDASIISQRASRDDTSTIIEVNHTDNDAVDDDDDDEVGHSVV